MSNSHQAFPASPGSKPNSDFFPQLQARLPLCLLDTSFGMSTYPRGNRSRTLSSWKQLHTPPDHSSSEIVATALLLSCSGQWSLKSVLSPIFLSNPASIPLGKPMAPAFKMHLKSNHCSLPLLSASWSWPPAPLSWLIPSTSYSLYLFLSPTPSDSQHCSKDLVQICIRSRTMRTLKHKANPFMVRTQLVLRVHLPPYSSWFTPPVPSASWLSLGLPGHVLHQRAYALKFLSACNVL